MQGKDDIIMVRSERKIKKYEIILCILVLAVIAAGLLLPETGNLVLLDELCNAAVIWIACIFVIMRILRNRTAMRILRNRTALSFSGKAVGAAAVIVCMAAALWFSKDIVPDLAAGPQTAILTDIQLSRTQAHTGIFSHHYYLLGIDPQGEKIRVEISGQDYYLLGIDLQGEKIRVEISGQDYERLETAGSVLIEYYPNTKRAVKLLPV